jgi:hypothetical protein
MKTRAFSPFHFRVIETDKASGQVWDAKTPSVSGRLPQPSASETGDLSLGASESGALASDSVPRRQEL